MCRQIKLPRRVYEATIQARIQEASKKGLIGSHILGDYFSMDGLMSKYGVAIIYEEARFIERRLLIEDILEIKEKDNG